MEIYLIRHTTPDIDKGICYGQTDIGMKNSFSTEALNILEKIPHNIEAIYTSPLKRCNALANFLAQKRKLPVAEDHRLMELNFGDWEMKNWDNIDPQALSVWMNNYITERCPRGESYLDLVARIKNFLLELQAARYKSIAIVTHAGVIRSFRAVAQNISLQEAMNIPLHYGSVTSVSITGTLPECNHETQ